jgi:hypothetical protein
MELAAGRRAAAEQVLLELIRDFPNHPARSYAEQTLLALRGPPPEPSGPRPTNTATRAETRPPSLEELLRNEHPTGLARAELVVGQAINGFAVGLELCGLASCNDTRLAVAMFMSGTALGIVGALVLTPEGITEGNTAAINTGMLWGFWNGLALTFGIAAPDSPDGRALAAALIGGQLVGLAAGELAYLRFAPGAGDVSFASSAGFWPGLLTFLIAEAAQSDTSNVQATILATLAVSDLGLVAGSFLTKSVPMSRGRVLLIDLGGAVGFLFGLGVDFLAQGSHTGRQDLLGFGALGTVLGLGTMTFLTRNWDLPEIGATTVGIVPVRGGAEALVGFAF